MSLQIHSNYFCLPIRKGCLVSNYNDRSDLWENVQLLQCDVIANSSEDLQVECCSFSPCGKYLAVCLSKYLIIYNTINWSFLSSIQTERKGVSIRFFPKSDVILIAEKSGSVKFFKFHENRIEKADIILGHNSMLIEALVTEDERFIITCDRDEKIRVTNYPNVYNIQCYCLGHTQFVCSINFLQSDKNILISSSGDSTIRLWEIKTGKQLVQFNNNKEKNNPSANNANFFTKITSLEISKDQSIIAALELNSNSVTIFKATGNIKNGVNMEMFHIIKHHATPYDIEFWQGNLVCLLEDEKYPVKIVNCKDNFSDNNENFKHLPSRLIDHWDLIVTACKKRAETFPSLFQYKKDFDASEDVKCKKIKCK